MRRLGHGLFALIALSWAVSATVPASALPPPRNPAHIVVVVFENHEYGRIIGNPDAPFINQLAGGSVLLTRSYALTHPSLPNYMGMLAGSTFNIKTDCTTCTVSASNLVDQLEVAGISWKAYMEDMPSPCFKGSSSGKYVVRHNPFMHFRDIVGSPARCNKVVPYTELQTDAVTGLPNFSFVVPNLCNDMHDCPVKTGDDWLRNFMAQVLPAVGPTGRVIVTWDEGTTAAGCCGGAKGGHVATIVTGPLAGVATTFDTPTTHYGLLKAIEQAWGLPLLGKAACSCTKSYPL